MQVKGERMKTLKGNEYKINEKGEKTEIVFI